MFKIEILFYEAYLNIPIHYYGPLLKRIGIISCKAQTRSLKIIGQQIPHMSDTISSHFHLDLYKQL